MLQLQLQAANLCKWKKSFSFCSRIWVHQNLHFFVVLKEHYVVKKSNILKTLFTIQYLSGLWRTCLLLPWALILVLTSLVVYFHYKHWSSYCTVELQHCHFYRYCIQCSASDAEHTCAKHRMLCIQIGASGAEHPVQNIRCCAFSACSPGGASIAMRFQCGISSAVYPVPCL